MQHLALFSTVIQQRAACIRGRMLVFLSPGSWAACIRGRMLVFLSPGSWAYNRGGGGGGGGGLNYKRGAGGLITGFLRYKKSMENRKENLFVNIRVEGCMSRQKTAD